MINFAFLRRGHASQLMSFNLNRLLNVLCIMRVGMRLCAIRWRLLSSSRGKRARKSKVSSQLGLWIFGPLISFFLAVTLDGTVIHKSGLMIGGRSTHNSGQKWEEE